MSHGKGVLKTFEHRHNISLSKIGAKNPKWMGDKVGYSGLHYWVRSRLPKTKLCESCKKFPPHDLANISQKYKRDLSDWEWLCRKCHMMKDGRLEAMQKLHYRRRLKENGYCKNGHHLIPPTIRANINGTFRCGECARLNTARCKKRAELAARAKFKGSAL